MSGATCTFRITPELSHTLDRRASTWGVSRSEVIRSALTALDLLLAPEMLSDPSLLSLLVASKGELAARVANALATAPTEADDP